MLYLVVVLVLGTLIYIGWRAARSRSLARGPMLSRVAERVMGASNGRALLGTWIGPRRVQPFAWLDLARGAGATLFALEHGLIEPS